MKTLTIAVCVKRVPDVNIQLDLDPVCMGVDSYDVAWEMNPHDRVALLQALRLAMDQGGSAVSLSVGPERAIEVLEESVAMGVDRAVWIQTSEEASSDADRVVRSLGDAIRSANPELVFCGSESADQMRGAVGIHLASLLGLPIVTSVLDIREIDREKGLLKLTKWLGGGLAQEIECPLPAVLAFAPNWALTSQEEDRADTRTLTTMLRSADAVVERTAPPPLRRAEETTDPWSGRGQRSQLVPSRRPGERPDGPDSDQPANERIEALFSSPGRLGRAGAVVQGAPDDIARSVVASLRAAGHLP
jgi:electron transfer flavoprotein alpha/beta subunit